jgi:hypothetical protein
MLGVFGLVRWDYFVHHGGMGMHSVPETEITNRKLFADYVGREYRWWRCALAWNDYPDKARILSISLMSPPVVVRNRFVSRDRALHVDGPWSTNATTLKLVRERLYGRCPAGGGLDDIFK